MGGGSVSTRIGAATHAGPGREVNEDHAFAGSTVFAVADGMGGHAAGSTASALAISCVSGLDEQPHLTANDIRGILLSANESIVEFGREYPERRGMGTTICGLGLVWVAGSAHWVVFNVGDSRVYRYAGGVLIQLTTDHSEVAELVAAGEIAPEQARNHPRRNILTRALGTDPAPRPDQWVLPAAVGERFLLCSDGLHAVLSDRQLETVLSDCVDPQAAADVLVRQAVEAGGRDDVTAVVVDRAHSIDQDPDEISVEDTAPRGGG